MSETRTTWQSPATGRAYTDLTGFHWWQGRLVICPACGSRPCDPDCAEQVTPDPRGQQWTPSADGPATPPPDSEPLVPGQPSPAGGMIGNGNPRQLIDAAFREAARRKAEALGAAAEEG